MRFLATIVLAAAVGVPQDAPDPKKIDAAIDKAVKFLKGKIPDGNDPSGQWKGMNELLLWTFLNAKVPKEDPDVRKLIKIEEAGCEPETYEVALRAMTLDRLDREKYRADIAECAQLLVDGQGVTGQWGYLDYPVGNGPAPKPKKPEADATGKFVIKRRAAKFLTAPSDNSNSQFAALGLRACHEAGIVLPRETLELAAKWWRDSQMAASGPRNAFGTPRGWNYGTVEIINGKKLAEPATGSMTCCAISSLAILDGLLGKETKKDAAIQDGLAWICTNYSVKSHPGYDSKVEGLDQMHLYYYLYSLERAGALSGTEKIGTHDWYAEGAKFLVESQKDDGTWGRPMGLGTVRDACFAVLFLRRATQSWVETPSK